MSALNDLLPINDMWHILDSCVEKFHGIAHAECNPITNKAHGMTGFIKNE